MINQKQSFEIDCRKFELEDTFAWKSVKLKNQVESYSNFIISGPKMDHYEIRPKSVLRAGRLNTKHPDAIFYSYGRSYNRI